MIENILLIDDDEATNYIHTRIITKWGKCKNTCALESAEEALDYLLNLKHNNQPNPDLILLDINMPRMNGWEFLESYSNMNLSKYGSKIVMLTTSQNPQDLIKSKTTKGVADLRHKPLSNTILDELTQDLLSA